MRQLGKGQSVVFCMPDEIRVKIRQYLSKETDDAIEVADVLQWAISETWMGAKQNMGLWTVQGKRFKWQKKLWDSFRDGGGSSMLSEDASMFLEAEGLTVKERHCARTSNTRQDSKKRAPEEFDEIDRRLREFGADHDVEANFQEQQERELAPEAEEEKQVERPEPAEPLAHVLHRDVLEFVRSGQLSLDSEAYKPAFEALSYTSAALKQDCISICDDLYVTADFANTVEMWGNSALMDSYQRPVQWVLTRYTSTRLGRIDLIMIISPFEAQEIRSYVMASPCVCLHIYAPRPNLGYKPLDSLDLFMEPQRVNPQLPLTLTIGLNLFAGQLHCETYDEYMRICMFLGVGYENFVSRHHSGTTTENIRRTPASFLDSLRPLMTRIRRSCESVDKTHIGTILDHRLLSHRQFIAATDADS